VPQRTAVYDQPVWRDSATTAPYSASSGEFLVGADQLEANSTPGEPLSDFTPVAFTGIYETDGGGNYGWITDGSCIVEGLHPAYDPPQIPPSGETVARSLDIGFGPTTDRPYSADVVS
jgi:hypothetical protein